MRFPVLDRSDAEALGRDDPGAVFPQTVGEVRNVGDGAEVVLVGRRSTQWYSGADSAPIVLVPGSPAVAAGASSARCSTACGSVRSPASTSSSRCSPPGVARWRPSPNWPMSCAPRRWATSSRSSATATSTTRTSARSSAASAGFSKGPLSLNLRGNPYLLTLDDIAGRVREAWDVGATEVCLQGGIHPDFDGDYYLDVARAVKEAAPDIHVHGFTALEVTEGAAV